MTLFKRGTVGHSCSKYPAEADALVLAGSVEVVGSYSPRGLGLNAFPSLADALASKGGCFDFYKR